MALTAYLPSTLESEQIRLRSLKGNTQLDYRSATGSAPYLLGTPYELDAYSSVGMNVAFPTVPTTTHITGDQSNYRRFSTDVLLASDDYQRNLFLLLVDDIQITAKYSHSYYSIEDYYEEGSTQNKEKHVFKVLNSNVGETLFADDTPNIYRIRPLLLDITNKEVGLVDTNEALVIKRKPFNLSGEFEYIEENEEGRIEFVVDSAKTTIVDKAIIPAAEVPVEIKTLDTFTASYNLDEEYYAHLIYVTPFKKDGSIFSTTNKPVLNDAYRNYYMYGNYKRVDKDIIGYSVNISPSSGAFLHAVFGTDTKDLSLRESLTIGESNFLYKTIYTGLLGSPYVMLKFNIDTSDTFSLKVNNTTHSLGSFSKATFFDLYKKLDSILEPLGFILICFENEHISIDRKTNSTTDIEISIESEKTSVETVNTFSDMAVLEDPTVLLSSGLKSHPKNASFTYIEPGITEDEIGNEIPDRESLLFKFVLTPNGTRPFNLGTETITLDVNSIKGRTLMVTISLGSKSINGELSFEASDTATQIVDKVFKLLTDNVTSTRYTFTKDYSNATITVLDKYSASMNFNVTFDIIDEEPPVLVSAQVDTNGIIYLTYNEKLRVGALDARTFTVIADSVGLEVKSSEVFAGDESRVKLTTFPLIGSGQTVELSYSGTNIKDTIGNLASNFDTAVETIPVTNESTNIPRDQVGTLTFNPYSITSSKNIVEVILNTANDVYSIPSNFPTEVNIKPNDYISSLQLFNFWCRNEGYEAIPLFEDANKTILSPNIGINKIADTETIFLSTLKNDSFELSSAKGLFAYTGYNTPAVLVTKDNYSIKEYAQFPSNLNRRIYQLDKTQTAYTNGRVVEGKIQLRDYTIKYNFGYGNPTSGTVTAELTFATNKIKALNQLALMLTGTSGYSHLPSEYWTWVDNTATCVNEDYSNIIEINFDTGDFKFTYTGSYKHIAGTIDLLDESDFIITKGFMVNAPTWLNGEVLGYKRKLYIFSVNDEIEGVY